MVLLDDLGILGSKAVLTEDNSNAKLACLLVILMVLMSVLKLLTG